MNFKLETNLSIEHPGVLAYAVISFVTFAQYNLKLNEAFVAFANIVRGKFIFHK